MMISPFGFLTSQSDTPPPSVGSRVLLLHADDFTDSSAEEHTLTNTGAAISTSNYKFATGSFDFGAGDYITSEITEDFNFGSDDLTIDFWVRPKSLADVTESTLIEFSNGDNDSTSRGWRISLGSYSEDFSLRFGYRDGTTFPYDHLVTNLGWSTSEFYHVAVVVSSSVLTIYINGASALSESMKGDASIYPLTDGKLQLNISELWTVTSRWGVYMDEVRIINGGAEWTSNFTPPVDPYGVGNDSDTVSLLHMNGSDTSTSFPDAADGGTHTWTASGNAQVSTTSPKFATGSLLLDGTGDYISTPDSSDWDFAGEDFTVDGWFYFDSNSTSSGLWQQFEDDPNRTGLNYDAVGDQLDFVSKVSGSTNVLVSASWVPTINTWYHIAVVRNGNDWRIYVDGTNITTSGGTDTSSLPDLTGDFYIGRYTAASSNYFDGKIDEFRVSKGIARWTSDFTVPTSPYGSE